MKELEYAISIRNLDFWHGKTQILKQISVDFRQGEFTTLLGRNGSGKSTLFGLIAGLEKYKNGSIKLLGEERRNLTFAQCAKRIGFMAQFHKPVFPFKVKEVVLTGRAAFSGLTPSKSDRVLVKKAIEELGISHLADRPYSELSGGEQQLTMIARVMVQKPPIILLDEPTNHLDVYYQTYVMQNLRKLCDQGMTVIAIMHDPNLALSYADQAYYLRDQHILSLERSPYRQNTDLLEYIYDVPFECIPNNSRNHYLVKQQSHDLFN